MVLGTQNSVYVVNQLSFNEKVSKDKKLLEKAVWVKGDRHGGGWHAS